MFVCIYHVLAKPQAKEDLNMGWLRLVGSLKLKVSFAECSLFYRALLQKRPIILRSLLIEATTYHAVEAGIAVLVSIGKWALVCRGAVQ